MIRAIYVGFVFFLFAAVAQAKVPKLILGEADGLPVECEVCGYDVEKGLVKLRAGDVCTNWSFSSFSTNVQAKIVGRATDAAFRSSRGLKISVDKKKYEVEVIADFSSLGLFSGDVTTVYYVITVENNSPFELTGISVDSSMFYEYASYKACSYQESRRRGDQVIRETSVDMVLEGNPRRVRTKTSAFSLRPGEVKTLETQPVEIRDGRLIRQASTTVEHPEYQSVNGQVVRNGTNTSRETDTKSTSCKDRFRGVCVLVGMSGSDGDGLCRMVKDGSVPEEKKWSEYKEQRSKDGDRS